MISITRWTSALLSAALLSGCSTMSVDFSDWAGVYSKAVEKAQNENLLMNMVRAAHQQPLYFTTIPVVSGSGSVSAGASLNAGYGPAANYTPRLFNWLTNPAASQVSPGLNLGVQSGFNFNMASLDNAEFLTGLLTPISPSAMHFYTSQRIPRELLFHLFIERVDLVGKTQTDSFVNDPTQKNYSKFIETLNLLLELGITTESGAFAVPVGPPITAEALSRGGVPALIQGATSGLQFAPVSGATGMEYQLQKWQSAVTFCFKRSPSNEKLLGASAFCNDPGKTRPASANQNQTFTFQYADKSLAIVIRSTREIFNYLGSQIYMQIQEKSGTPLTLRSQEAKDLNYMKLGDQLLVVKKNQTRSDDLYRVEYRGDTYSVPAQGPGYTPLVFTILSQVVTLSKAVNLIPASAPVLVR